MPRKDPYVYDDNETLKNKFDIRDAADLKAVESALSSENIERLAEHLPDVRTMSVADALRRFHRGLFGDIYEWAGTYRTINQTKRTAGELEHYVPHEQISDALDLIQNSHLENVAASLSEDGYAEALAKMWGGLHTVHPLREGNTRTISLYLDALTQHTEHRIVWHAADYFDTRVARAEVTRGNIAPLTEITSRILRRETLPPMTDHEAHERVHRTNAILRLAGNDVSAELDAMKFDWLTGRITESQLDDRREDYLRRVAPSLTTDQLAMIRATRNR